MLINVEVVSIMADQCAADQLAEGEDVDALAEEIYHDMLGQNSLGLFDWSWHNELVTKLEKHNGY